MFFIYVYFLFGYFREHKSRILFSLLGISLGIALYTSTEINSYKAEKSLKDPLFGFSQKSITGRFLSKDELNGNSEYILQKIYDHTPEDLELDPILSRSGTTKDQNYTPFVVFGKDLISASVSNFFTTSQKIEPQQNIKLKSEIFISTPLYSKVFENTNTIYVEICNQSLLLDKQNINIIESPGNFLLFDLRKLQSICNAEGKLDMILLVSKTPLTPEQEKNITKISNDYGFIYESKETIEERTSKALGSLKLNLTIVSLVSVLISFFMVANSFSGLYVSRKKEFGILLSLGVSRRTNFFLFLAQGLVLGLLGGIIGAGLGYFFTKLNLFHITNTLASASDIQSYTDIPIRIYLSAMLISGIGSIGSATFNAYKTYKILPIEFLREKEVQLDSHRSTVLNHKFFLLGFGLILLGYFVSLLDSPKQILPGLVGVGMVILGFVMLNLWSLQRLIPIVVNKFEKFQSFVFPNIGLREIAEESWKHALTSSTIMLSVSLVLTLTALTDSYRSSLIKWAEIENTEDFSILNPQKLNSGLPGVPIEFFETIKKESSFAKIEPFLIKPKFGVNSGLFTLNVLKFESKYNKDELIVSDNFCYLEKLCVGDDLLIPIETGEMIPMRIQATKEHFFSERGTILMDYSLYQKHFQLKELNSVRVHFDNRKSFQESKSLLQSYLKDTELKEISRSELIDLYLEGMDQVFSVLSSLKGTAIVISLLAIITSLIHYIKEKSILLAGLRAIGMDSRQGFSLLLTQSSFLLMFGSMFGILNSFVLSPIVVYGINRNAFGWNLEFNYPFTLLFLLSLSLPLIAFLVSVFPFYHFKSLKIARELSHE
ncbi:MAG: ABC transporter permease [Leptospira sp.]|nr:ABC transporter permease [Leptospira sp.]